MNGFSLFLLGAALLLVVGSLVVGLFFMARGREGDAQKSNTMMRWRVALQGVALLCFVLAVMLRG